MRFLVFLLVVIANYSDNSKASLDSVSPTSANSLLKDTTIKTDKSCNRPCKLNVKARRCSYKFKIEPFIDEDGRAALSINDMIPGPSINVCVNDIVVVEVENKVPDQDLTIHWHGLDQKGTPFMDGVPMVTQCPIGYGSKYKYAFRSSKAGTYFYHADSVLHQSDGIFGALVVNQPPPFEPNLDHYDYDRSKEHSLVISAVFPQILTGNLEDLSRLKPLALNVNGEADITKVFVMEKYSYRLRLINAIGIDCPIVYNIERHDITVIATDGSPVKPVTGKNVLLYPGERMDVVVHATQDPAGYWMYVRGYGGACAGLRARAMLIYSGFNYTSMLVNDKKEVTTDSDINLTSIVYGQNLESLSNIGYDTAKDIIYLAIDRNFEFKNTFENDFTYHVGENKPKAPFFPAPLTLRQDGVVQINRKNFLYPNSPLLLTPENIPLDIICKVGEEEKHIDPQCVQILTLNQNEVVELVLLNEGFNSNNTYTFHLHGYSMQVVATWQNPKKTPISRAELQNMAKEGLSRNILNPPLKDTVVVPNKGYTIVRIKPDHPGAWIFECRSCSLYSLPTAILISVPQSLPKPVQDSLPKCGSYRPPDVLLN